MDAEPAIGVPASVTRLPLCALGGYLRSVGDARGRPFTRRSICVVRCSRPGTRDTDAFIAPRGSVRLSCGSDHRA